MEEVGLDNNGCLKILTVKKVMRKPTTWQDIKTCIEVIVKVLKPTGNLHTSWKRNLKPCFKICVDFFDAEGNPIGGSSRFVHIDSTEMVAGQIATVNIFGVPDYTKFYRVWLPRQK